MGRLIEDALPGLGVALDVIFDVLEDDDRDLVCSFFVGLLWGVDPDMVRDAVERYAGIGWDELVDMRGPK